MLGVAAKKWFSQIEACGGAEDLYVQHRHDAAKSEAFDEVDKFLRRLAVIKKSQSGIGFYLLFAITITASVQLVGVYLVFSSLVIPALAVHRLPAGKRKMLLAYLCGVAGYISGLLVSTLADLPSSPTIVLSLTACAILFWWLIALQSRQTKPDAA